MIVVTKDDLVRLEGSLVKNQWLTIKAAANLALRDHPQGIIIDCSELQHVSEDGAKTFLEAMKDIQAAGARMLVAALPEDVLRVIRTVPTVRSQLPIAASVEDARASLRLSGAAPAAEGDKPVAHNGILVPLVQGTDVDYAVTVAGRIARETRLPIHLVYFLEVARDLPLNAPLAQEETAAHRILEQAGQSAKRQTLPAETHLERTRNVVEGILQSLKAYKAAHVVLGAFAEHGDAERFHEIVEALLHRAPCNVLIVRRALDAGGLQPI